MKNYGKQEKTATGFSRDDNKKKTRKQKRIKRPIKKKTARKRQQKNIKNRARKREERMKGPGVVLESALPVFISFHPNDSEEIISIKRHVYLERPLAPNNNINNNNNNNNNLKPSFQ